MKIEILKSIADDIDTIQLIENFIPKVYSNGTFYSITNLKNFSEVIKENNLSNKNNFKFILLIKNDSYDFILYDSITNSYIYNSDDETTLNGIFNNLKDKFEDLKSKNILEFCENYILMNYNNYDIAGNIAL